MSAKECPLPLSFQQSEESEKLVPADALPKSCLDCIHRAIQKRNVLQFDYASPVAEELGMESAEDWENSIEGEASYRVARVGSFIRKAATLQIVYPLGKSVANVFMAHSERFYFDCSDPATPKPQLSVVKSDN